MNKKIYKCLVASPGDTAIERETCLKVFNELNDGIGEKFGFVIEKRMWEYNTRPAFGDYSQAVISEQLGDDYDIFIGIMYKKFGTETKMAGSGTEEEFNNAYNRLLKKENIEIMFYFNDEASKLSEINPDELLKVNSFKKKVANLGGYYWNYNGPQNFETVLRRQLSDYFLKASKSDAINNQSEILKETIRLKLKERLDRALCIFDSQPIIWVDPVISNTNEISNNADENFKRRIDVKKIISNPSSTIIKAPPQFGLTCLAHYLVKEAWEIGDFWVYIDSQFVKPHNIHKKVIQEAESIGLKLEDIKCIVIDSWNNYEIDSFKKLKNVCEEYKEIPIIVMQTIDNSKFLIDNSEIKIDKSFDVLHLLALPRTQIRKVVSEYNKAKDIAAEEALLSKVIDDLEVLNIHRTPFNCLTLLKVSEKYFDQSPVNRTQMLEMVLFVLFNMDGIPTYKTKPDLKDCEYVLGRFCEKLIRNERYSFQRQSFIDELNSFCKEKLIDLEIDVVFDVLAANQIITKIDLDYVFRSSYWIFYFAAKRMHNDKDFNDYIFKSKKYISCPEIIEFYTGIDRSRSDALEILKNDIQNTCEIVNAKVALPENMNPFGLIKWKPTEEQILKVQDELSENVINSGLPDSVKDQHADKNYNQIRPYNQNIQSFLEEYSLLNLMQNIRASSRALRNSDYVSPEIKKDILKEILRGWNQISKVLLALSPILAQKGEAKFEGQGFYLEDGFGATFEERINGIIQANLTNVVGFFKNDIFSSKIGPLLFDHFTNETDQNIKHQLALLFVFTRPRGWKAKIEDYIVCLHKNSFYLFDILNSLRGRYAFDFANSDELNEISYLIKMCYAKHEFGSKKPGLHEIVKISNKSLPTRDSDKEK
ncbi:hypothetical protein P278_07330 [Sporocytophaga myxococcoides]|uniref:STAND NTPase 4 small alpha/beta domain-containing protein n=1 Tax=Sporocytophaga myxococcoides TaxID=153721 RepID=A0A098LKP8_9BACT|nr:hypothetical protein [Sporocytophaga myxococcoides]GAL87540.1 hypothetical protein P278_07330 [Sporocytophaga myxococcoides]